MPKLDWSRFGRAKFVLKKKKSIMYVVISKAFCNLVRFPRQKSEILAVLFSNVILLPWLLRQTKICLFPLKNVTVEAYVISSVNSTPSDMLLVCVRFKLLLAQCINHKPLEKNIRLPKSSVWRRFFTVSAFGD